MYFTRFTSFNSANKTLIRNRVTGISKAGLKKKKERNLIYLPLIPGTIRFSFFRTPQYTSRPTRLSSLTATVLTCTLLNPPGLLQQTLRGISVSSVAPINSILNSARRMSFLNGHVTSGSKQDGEVARAAG